MRYLRDSIGDSVPRSAVVSGSLFGLASAFQVALAAGAPWGRLAWGGGHEGRLPTGLRVASVGSAIVLLGIAAVVVRRRRGRVVALRMVLGFSVVSAVVNAASPSVPERLVWTPFAIVQCALIAMTLLSLIHI